MNLVLDLCPPIALGGRVLRRSDHLSRDSVPCVGIHMQSEPWIELDEKLKEHTEWRLDHVEVGQNFNLSWERELFTGKWSPNAGLVEEDFTIKIATMEAVDVTADYFDTLNLAQYLPKGIQDLGSWSTWKMKEWNGDVVVGVLTVLEFRVRGYKVE